MSETGQSPWIVEQSHVQQAHRVFVSLTFRAPAGLYDKFYEKSTALRLYVRRVLISDEFEDFLPRYLNFIRSVPVTHTAKWSMRELGSRRSHRSVAHLRLYSCVCMSSEISLPDRNQPGSQMMPKLATATTP